MMRNHHEPNRRQILLGGVGTALLSGAGLPASAASADAGDAITARALADSIGVNVHESYLDSTYVDGRGPAPTVAALRALGVSRVRLGLAKQPRDFVPRFYRDLRSIGVRILAVAGTPTGRWGTFALGDGALLHRALTNGDLRGRLWGIEMPNEWDASGDPSWTSDLSAFTREFAAAIESAPSPPVVLAPSMARPLGYTASGLTGVAQSANIHPYAGDQMPESDRVLPLWVRPSLRAARGGRVVASELGWQTAEHADRAVTEQVQADYLMRSLLWNRTHGVEQSYVYELFDQQPDPSGMESELHYGLVAVTGDPKDRTSWVQRPKPAYTQLRRLLAGLADRGAGPMTRLPVQLIGAPSDVTSMSILRRDGSQDLAIWRRVELPERIGTSTEIELRFDRPVRASLTDLATGRIRRIGSAVRTARIRVRGTVRTVRFAPA